MQETQQEELEDSKSVTKKKAEKDSQVSAYEREINKQKAAAKTKTTTPKDNNRDNEKVKVPKKNQCSKTNVPKIVAPKPTFQKNLIQER